MKIESPVSREHYLQRCWPVISRILNSNGRIRVIDAGCGHAHESILFSALGAEVIGIDLREDGFKVALENVSRFKSVFPSLNVRLINRNIFDALQSLTADVIWVRQALSHIHPAESFIEIASHTLNTGGLIVINDSNSANPLVIFENVAEHWNDRKSITWYVTDKYKDPVTSETVPYAVERLLSAKAIKRMLLKSGFSTVTVDFSGYLPVSAAAKVPRIAQSLESVLKRAPLVSAIGREYVIVGRKA